MSIHPIMQKLAAKLERTDLPEFAPGDTVRVQVKIREGEKERLQAFEGMVIACNKGAQGSFTVRKMSFGQGVERIFPYNSQGRRQSREDSLLRSSPLEALLSARSARQGCPSARGRARRRITIYFPVFHSQPRLRSWLHFARRFTLVSDGHGHNLPKNA